MDGDLAERMGLGVSNQPAVDNAILDADREWDKASRFRLSRPSTPTVAHQLYFDSDVLPFSVSATTRVDGVVWYDDLSISSSVVFYNEARTWSFNLNDYPNVWKVTVHELGHVLGLDDDPKFTWHDGGYSGGDPALFGQCYGCTDRSVMWGANLPFTGLYIDDKEAVTMQYGINTRFEQSEFLGLHTNMKNDPRWNMGIYDNCSITEPSDGLWYWTYDPSGSAAGDGVPASPTSLGASGGRFMRFRGCSRVGSGAEYAYMTLAWADHDSAGQDRNPPSPAPCMTAFDYTCALEIQSGMTLSWWQYNKKPDTGYQTHCTAAIDLELIKFLPGGGVDVTTLRDVTNPWTGQPMKDTVSIRAHPAYRQCNVAGQNWENRWFKVTVDLAPLEGYYITRYMVAYDNGQGNLSNKWRVYFDDVRITVPQ